MPLQQIIANAKGMLQAVSGVANVYDHLVYANDDKTVASKFTDTNSRIHAWMITRPATQGEDRGPNNEYDVHRLQIRGYLGVSEAAGTEGTFQDLVEAVRAAFNANRKFDFNSTKAAHWSKPMQAPQVIYVMFAGVLCHYCELTMDVDDGPNSTMSA